MTKEMGKTAAQAESARRTGLWKRLSEKFGFRHWQLYLLILPAILYLAVFCYAPMYGIVVAFQSYTPVAGVFGSKWIGFANFASLFKSYWFKIMLKNTLEISLYSLLINTPLPIILALFLNEVRHSWFKKTVQTISYAPYFVSVIVVVGMCFSFTNPEYGVVNKLIEFFGGDPVAMMFDPKYFKMIYIVSGLWQGLGWWSIIYVATLSTVDPALHEAATIDGAGRFQRMVHINVPAIIPTAVILFILAIGNLMSVGFEKAFLMQNSGNLESSEIIATYAYKVSIGAQGYKNYGFGAAVGLFNSFINIILLVLANFTSKTVGKESLW